jgi:hypothetical protein
LSYRVAIDAGSQDAVIELAQMLGNAGRTRTHRGCQASTTRARQQLTRSTLSGQTRSLVGDKDRRGDTNRPGTLELLISSVPGRFVSWVRRFRSDSSKSTASTEAPSVTNRVTAAAPIARAAPVTISLFPCSDTGNLSRRAYLAMHPLLKLARASRPRSSWSAASRASRAWCRASHGRGSHPDHQLAELKRRHREEGPAHTGSRSGRKPRTTTATRPPPHPPATTQ